MKKYVDLLLIVSALCAVSCVQDRTFTGDNLPAPPQPAGTLLINEFVSKGSLQLNEFGVGSDWIELYNPSTQPLTLAAGQWYVTDDSTAQTKYVLPARTIAPRDFLLIWCDSRDTVANQIHTSFNLSSAGGDVGLYQQMPGGATRKADLYHYPLQTLSAASLGRTPDGGATWRVFTIPTPGALNR